MKISELFENTKSGVEGLRPDNIQNIINDEVEIYGKSVSVTDKNKIPGTGEIPIEKPTHWIRVKDVICVYVDMEGSTRMSATQHPGGTAKIYRLFTNTAIRIFHDFGASYIDVKGDGVFALFNYDRPHTALASAVSFKTFVRNEFTPMVEEKTKLTIGGHYGIDQKSVLVRKLGLKRVGDRTDRQNEVWAGRTVNMAAKLASKSTGDTLWVSDRYHKNLKDPKATHTCGCPNGESVPLWDTEDVSGNDLFDFNTVYVLGTNWCKNHGKSFCRDLIIADGSD